MNWQGKFQLAISVSAEEEAMSALERTSSSRSALPARRSAPFRSSHADSWPPLAPCICTPRKTPPYDRQTLHLSDQQRDDNKRLSSIIRSMESSTTFGDQGGPCRPSLSGRRSPPCRCVRTPPSTCSSMLGQGTHFPSRLSCSRRRRNRHGRLSCSCLAL